jgi:hypothetical protein
MLVRSGRHPFREKSDNTYMLWPRALEIVLQVIDEPLRREQLRWAVIGSVASTLQGCHFEPGDIDILANAPETVQRIAEVMRPHTPLKPIAPPGNENWLSSQELPVNVGPDPSGAVWHFARWLIDGVKIEVAHIQAPKGFATAADGAGIWEAGPEIWPHIRFVNFANFSVPVVPLEIQLQTNLGRGRTERCREIQRVLEENAYDRELLKKSLARANWEAFRGLL